MGLFSFLGGLFKAFIILGVIAFMTVIPTGVLISIIVALNIETPLILHRVAVILYLGLFGATSADIVLRRRVQAARYTIPIVLVATPVLMVINFVSGSIFSSTGGGQIVIDLNLLLILGYVGVFSYLAIDIARDHISGLREKSTTTGSSTAIEQFLIGSESSNLVGAYEVVELPEEYANPEEEVPREQIYEPFYNLLRGTNSHGAPLGLRIQYIRGQTRAFFLTLGSTRERLEKSMLVLQNLLRAQLPRFRIERCEKFETPHSKEEGYAVFLKGEPLTIENQRQRHVPLTAVVRRLQLSSNGVIQIFATPSPKGLIPTLTRWLRKREYESKSKQARFTTSGQRSGLLSRGEQSETHVDVVSMDDADRAFHELQRYKAAHSCELRIAVASWESKRDKAEQTAKMLAQVLKSSVLPSDPERDIKTKGTSSASSLQRILKGQLVGPKTRLTFEEAVMFFVFPRTDSGIRTTKRSSFSTAVSPTRRSSRRTESRVSEKLSPTTGPWGKIGVLLRRHQFDRDVIVLGNPIQESGEIVEANILAFDPQIFRSHMFIVGTTGTGKTTSARSIAAQAIRFGVNPLILVPVKPWEWYPLLSAALDFRYFTAANPKIAPLRLNIWNPPPGVPLFRWKQRLVDVFCAWFPNDRVMTLLFDAIIHATYEDCGWTEEERGRPILMQDFFRNVIKVCKGMRYGDDLKSNFRGALYLRAKHMLLRSRLIDMYNTDQGITIPELLEHPTIIDTSILDGEDRALLAGILTAAVSEYRLANPVDSIENVLIIEEAHSFLPRTAKHDEYGGSAQAKAVDNIVEMLRVVGGAGLGILLLSQLPSDLAVKAIQLPRNVIIHAIAHEVELVGKQARCSDAQIEHIPGMEAGESVVFLQNRSVPINVQVIRLEELLSVPKSGTEPEEQIKKRMAEVFRAKPALEHSVPISQEEMAEFMAEFEDSTRVEVEVLEPSAMVKKILNSQYYMTFCRKQLSRGSESGLREIAEMIVTLSWKIPAHESEAINELHYWTMRELGISGDSDMFHDVLSKARDVAEV